MFVRKIVNRMTVATLFFTGSVVTAAEVSHEQALKQAEEILEQLSLEEKVKLCHGSGSMTIGTLPQVGVDTEFQMSDNSSSVRPDMSRNDWSTNNATATAFPSMSALAATWDRSMAARFGDALGKEARARGKDMMLGPGVNIHRTPICGRNWEYLSEDPFLAARLAVPYVKALQSNNVAATVKHFVANNQELKRFSCSSNPDERTLREIYFPAFKAAVQEGGALAIMSGYNRFRGEYCSHSDYLNNQVLKNEWGFKGLVVSDWGGLHDTVKGALGGTDLEMNQGKRINYFKQPLLDAVKKQTISQKVLDDKVRRILYVMAKTKFLGEHSDREKGQLETPEHTELARSVAEQAITLLKNDDNVLPLDQTKIKKLLVIGDNATRKHCQGGGSAEANPKYEVSPLDGIEQLVGSNVDVQYRNIKELGGNITQIPEVWIKTLDPNSKRVGLGQPAFKVDYFNNSHFGGKSVYTSYETKIDFNRDKVELQGVAREKITVRWTATVSPNESGDYILGATVSGGGVRIYIDGKPVVNSKHGRKRLLKGGVELEKGQEYQLNVEYFGQRGFLTCEFGLVEEAVADFNVLAAEVAASDAVIYFTGNNHGGSTNFESEGADRVTMKLLDCDNRAIAAVLKAKPEAVIVNLSGVGVEMPWIDQAATLVQYYFSGQEGGHAIANVLFGRVNPSGKLLLRQNCVMTQLDISVGL